MKKIILFLVSRKNPERVFCVLKMLCIFMILIFIVGCAKQQESPAKTSTKPSEIISEQKERPETQPLSLPYPDSEPGEWHPDKDTNCQSPEFMDKCNQFCSKHPQYCPGWEEPHQPKEYSRTTLPLPAEKEISSLSRNYPAVIKCINEGPNIYPKTGPENVIISDEKLEKIKESGFNTVQVMLIGKWEGDKIVFNEENNLVLLNDIIAIKKHGLAVWVALDMAGGPPVPGVKLGESYENFKPAFLNLVDISSKLMEQYQVEYLTVNNEPDKYFGEQTSWGSKEQVNNYLADFFVSTTLLTKEDFKGKLINKITLVRQHDKSVIDASLQNVDIAGVDVGPSMEGMSIAEYKQWFEDYQFYATAAQKKGIPWMNAEYWQYDFDPVPSQFIKDNQLKYAKISFDAYLNTNPKGIGYVWNDFGTFSLEPNGEATRQEIKKFFGEIG